MTMGIGSICCILVKCWIYIKVISFGNFYFVIIIILQMRKFGEVEGIV